MLYNLTSVVLLVVFDSLLECMEDDIVFRHRSTMDHILSFVYYSSFQDIYHARYILSSYSIFSNCAVLVTWEGVSLERSRRDLSLD